MGNSNSSKAPDPSTSSKEVAAKRVAASLIQKKWKKQHTVEFKWPENLHVELRDMNALVELGSYLDAFFEAVLRPTAEEEGIILPELTNNLGDGTAVTSKLTLARIASILNEENDVLVEKLGFPLDPDKFLQLLQQITENTSSRKISIVTLLDNRDNPQPETQPYYHLIRDDQLKRITIVLKSDLAEYQKSWTTQLNWKKSTVTLNRTLAAKISGDRISTVGVHPGFYQFLFQSDKKKNKTNKSPEKDNDAGIPTNRYKQLVMFIKTVTKSYPKHRLYITGFGVAGAIGHLLSFFLTFEDNSEIPKPISCINFSSPRVGDADYWRACQLLEIAGKWRTCRTIMDTQDSWPSYPSGNGYTHAGYQVALGKDGTAMATYPSVSKDGAPRFWMFSKKSDMVATRTLQDYSEALKSSEEKLKKMDLNNLYVAMGARNLMYASQETPSSPYSQESPVSSPVSTSGSTSDFSPREREPDTSM